MHCDAWKWRGRGNRFWSVTIDLYWWRCRCYWRCPSVWVSLKRGAEGSCPLWVQFFINFIQFSAKNGLNNRLTPLWNPRVLSDWSVNWSYVSSCNYPLSSKPVMTLTWDEDGCFWSSLSHLRCLNASYLNQKSFSVSKEILSLGFIR